ncbi:hypothetical protein PSP31121_05699 [Pandoraea sputorum]|uniref:Uncharacterized protein n=1 Tax=Pandoraea sputorum TaxID=93222 RepID=A0A5E5BP23_9BURK|nr:hypothetical protein PSP31121_05699 [Pandoraea sputorum]
MTILTLRAGALCCFTPKLTEADLKRAKDTRNPDELQSGGTRLSTGSTTRRG